MSMRQRVGEWMDEYREFGDAHLRTVRRTTLIIGAGAAVTAIAFSPLWRRRRAGEVAGLARAKSSLAAQVLTLFGDGTMQATTLPPLRRIAAHAFASAASADDEETFDVRLLGVRCDSSASRRWLRERAVQGLPLVRVQAIAWSPDKALGRGVVLASVWRRAWPLAPLQRDLAVDMVLAGAGRADAASVWHGIADGSVAAGATHQEEAEVREAVRAALERHGRARAAAAGGGAADGASGHASTAPNGDSGSACEHAAAAARQFPGAAALVSRLEALHEAQARADELAAKAATGWVTWALQSLFGRIRGRAQSGTLPDRAARRQGGSRTSGGEGGGDFQRSADGGQPAGSPSSQGGAAPRAASDRNSGGGPAARDSPDDPPPGAPSGPSQARKARLGAAARSAAQLAARTAASAASAVPKAASAAASRLSEWRASRRPGQADRDQRPRR